jgi:hypothetical protein
MKRKLKKIAGIIVSYIILASGILCWLKVSHETESRLDSALTAMAQIKSEPEGICFSILGNELIIDTSFIYEDDGCLLYLTCSDPLIAAVWTAASIYNE